MEKKYEQFFENKNLNQIKKLFLENDFSKEEIKKIEYGVYDPYKEY